MYQQSGFHNCQIVHLASYTAQVCVCVVGWLDRKWCLKICSFAKSSTKTRQLKIGKNIQQNESICINTNFCFCADGITETKVVFFIILLLLGFFFFFAVAFVTLVDTPLTEEEIKEAKFGHHTCLGSSVTFSVCEKLCTFHVHLWLKYSFKESFIIKNAPVFSCIKRKHVSTSKNHTRLTSAFVYQYREHPFSTNQYFFHLFLRKARLSLFL